MREWYDKNMPLRTMLLTIAGHPQSRGGIPIRLPRHSGEGRALHRARLRGCSRDRSLAGVRLLEKIEEFKLRHYRLGRCPHTWDSDCSINRSSLIRAATSFVGGRLVQVWVPYAFACVNFAILPVTWRRGDAVAETKATVPSAAMTCGQAWTAAPNAGRRSRPNKNLLSFQIRTLPGAGFMQYH